MNKEKHNGWTNYATWRVNLELVDGIHFVHEDVATPEEEITIDDVANFLRDSVVGSVIDEERHTEGVHAWILDYAEAFLQDVNWHEIAEHVVENYPDILKKTV